MNATKEQTKAALQVVVAVAEAIRELKSIPSGHLYARLMDKLSLDQYNSIIGLLKRQGLVSESNYLLTWIEPD